MNEETMAKRQEEKKKEEKKIKKLYGENMMHLCRALFPTILEEPGQLLKYMTDNFYPNKFLYNDIISNNKKDDFKDFIYSQLKVKDVIKESLQTPKELLEAIGYDFYECHNESDIESFKKYYYPGEELCTFYSNRLKFCHVFWAIKKNVNEIKREEFSNPTRQDDYGTSVISIQFSRGQNNTLSIKNRYNHTVINPDATFSNNLENIIPGLTSAFEKTYGLNIRQSKRKSFELPNYIEASDGRLYKYNYEINNVYYCPDNIIIENSEIKKLDKEKYIVLDYFILDLENKKIETKGLEDSFADGIKDIEDIKVQKAIDRNGKEITITTKTNNKIVIEIDEKNRIIGYKNNELEVVGPRFLSHNTTLQNLELSNLKTAGDYFLTSNNALKTLVLNNLTKIGHNFMRKNHVLEYAEMNNLVEAGDSFFEENQKLKEIHVPNLKTIGNNCLKWNLELTKLIVPKLERVGDFSLIVNKKIEYFEAPNLEETGHHFLMLNKAITKFVAPKLRKVGDEFLSNNECLTELELSNLEEVGNSFFSRNNVMTKLELPKLQKTGSCFFASNQTIQELTLPSLKEIGYTFFYKNPNLSKFIIPNLNEESQKIVSSIIKEHQKNKDFHGQRVIGIKKSSSSTSKLIDTTKKLGMVIKKIVKEIGGISQK